MASRRALIAQLNQIYNAHRTYLLNRKYYGYRLEQYRKRNRNLEIVIAVVTSSAVGSWAIWKIGWISPFWSVILGIAAVLSIIKPLLQWPKEIERYSKLFAGYAVLYQDLDNLVSDIAVEQDVTPSMWTSYKATRERAANLVAEDDTQPIEELRKRFRIEVNKDKPLQKYWAP